MGILRDILFARNFGASIETDIYFASFLFSDILLLLCISSAIMGISTPLFLREKQKDEELGYKTFGQFFLVLNLIFLGVIILTYLFLPDLLTWLYPKYMESSEYREILITLSTLALVSNFFFALSNTLGSFLMAHKYFLSTALAPLAYNIGIIGGIILFSQQYGIYAAAYGAIAGAGLHLGFRILEYIKYIPPSQKFTLNSNANTPVLKELLLSMITRWPAVVIFPALTFFFFAKFSITYAEGAYSLFSYARNITFAPVAIFSIAITTSAFPVFSEYFAQKEYTLLSNAFWKAFEKIIFWMIPFTIGILFLGHSAYDIVYNIPNESKSDFIQIGVMFFILSFSLLFESITNLFSRVFNAMEDTKTPLFSSLIFFSIIIGGTYFFYRLIGDVLIVLALSYTIAFFAQTLFYSLSLLRYKSFTWQNPFSLQLLASGGMLLYFLFIQQLLPRFEGIISLAIHTLISGFIFLSILIVLWRKKTISKIKQML